MARLPRRTWESVRLVAHAFLIALLSLGVVSCKGFGPSPDNSVIQQSVVRQFEQTHHQLQQQLSLNPAKADFQVTGVKVNRIQKITSRDQQDQLKYRVQGTYVLSGKSISRALHKTRNPFEIYLQSQDDGQTWKLQRQG